MTVASPPPETPTSRYASRALAAMGPKPDPSSTASGSRARLAAHDEYERQRVAHLVLGQPRPPIEMPRRPKDVPKQEWKVRRAELRKVGVTLAPGIEEQVLLAETWSHKGKGTPATHEHHAVASRREGCLARLATKGSLDVHQLRAAEQIAAAHAAIGADVAVRTAKFEPRGTGGGHDAAETERLRSVLFEQQYSRWRMATLPDAGLLLAIIVDDMALTTAARRWRKSNRRALAILVRALDDWWHI